MNIGETSMEVLFRTISSHASIGFSNIEISLREAGSQVSAKITLPDLLDFSKRSFIKSWILSRSTPLSVHSELPSIPFDERISGSISCGVTGRILRVSEGGSGSAGSDKNAVFLEIWDKDTELVRVLIPDCRGVNFNGSFGSPIFMPDGETVMFVGEKSDPKFPRGYWAENKDNVDPADKFRYQPDYGETMTKVRAPKLIAFNYVENEWKTIEIDGYHLAFPRSVPGCPDSLLVVGYKRSSKLHVPGLSYCSNRDSCLFRIDNIWSNNIEKSNLSEGLYMVGAATVSSDGSVALFAGQETYFSSHCTELDLFRLDLGDKFSKPVRLNIPKIRSDDSIVPSWNGLYLLTQADAGQISFPPSGDKIVVPTYSSGKSGIFIIDIQKEIVVQSVFPPDITEFSSVMLMQVSGNQIVFVHQGYTCPRSLWLASLDDACNIQYVKLFSVPSANKLNTLPWYANAKVELIQTPNCPAWLLRSGKEDSPKPLIGYFHGGPHSLALTAFAPEIACYLAAGYDLIIPNYRGSIGFGKEFLNSLIGNAGIVDVADCHACVLEAKRILRPSITVAVGGSHGGFLTAWLVGHPDMKHEYAGGVLWNPASDITSMSLTSDIPEWALSQVLSLEECRKESALCPSESFFHKALKRSPMSVVRNVTAPVMVLLGSTDKRVVPCAGLRWAQAVEEYGGKVDLFWFPDQGHAIAGPEFNETAIVAKSKWIESLVRKV